MTYYLVCWTEYISTGTVRRREKSFNKISAFKRALKVGGRVKRVNSEKAETLVLPNCCFSEQGDRGHNDSY